MRQLHWGKVPDAKVKGTLWDGEITDEHVKLDVEELETLFAAAQAKSKVADGDEPSASQKEKKKSEVVTLVDPKTANNTAIALSRFRKTPEEIAASLLAGDGQCSALCHPPESLGCSAGHHLDPLSSRDTSLHSSATRSPVTHPRPCMSAGAAFTDDALTSLMNILPSPEDAELVQVPAHLVAPLPPLCVHARVFDHTYRSRPLEHAAIRCHSSRP